MIRFIVGLLVVFGCVGGLDSATGDDFLILLCMTIAGLALMYFGSEKIKQM
jgi:hypothetical protein